jgi:glycosyltransferase involved in cell wall biosynthesis
MYDDPAGREKMGIDGKKFVEHEFTWEKTSFELVNIYDELESSVDNKK